MSETRSEILPAERQLLKSLASGERCKLGDERPKGIDPQTYSNKMIRSSFLCDLILGKISGAKIHHTGLRIFGAWISGDLNLSGVSIAHTLDFQSCYFVGSVDLSSADIRDLILKGSRVYSLHLDNVNCVGNIVLSYGFSTNRPVIARAAKISGQLGCSGGEFANADLAMTIESAKIGEAFFWRGVQNLSGILDMTNAHVRTLVDDPDSWPIAGKLRLDGLQYDQLGSNTSANYFLRIEWLERQFTPHLTFDFRPQPFEQLRRVLDASGREEEAKKVAIKKLSLQRRADWLRCDPELITLQQSIIHERRNILRLAALVMMRDRIRKRNLYFFSHAGARLKWFRTYLFGLISGYGYRPFRCVTISAILIALGSVVFSAAQKERNIVPRDSAILATLWVDAVSAEESNPYNQFHDKIPSYPRFNALAFSIDTFIPFIDLGQESSWAIDTKGTKWSDALLQWYGWLYTLVGWTLTALFGASITGIVRK